jgi:hypothetical protein
MMDGAMTHDDQSPPVACSLDAGELGQRLDEWRALVRTHVSSVDTTQSSVRLTLDGSDDALVAAASLGSREKACCPFFDVAVELGPATRVLRLSVPDGAEAVLEEFAALLRP